MITRAALVLVVTFGSAAHLAAQNDVLATLGTTVREAQDSIFMTLTSGAAALTGERSVFRAASGEARAAMVKAVARVARAFASSPEFARRYAAFREAQKPERAEVPRSGDEARAQQQQAMEAAVKEAMASARQLPPEARRQMEETIAEMRRQMAELNADPEYRAGVDQIAADAAKLEEQEYAERLAAFNEEYPADVNALIARRLRQFLQTCGDVDFNAKLEPRPDKKMRFANPDYEERSPEWKMCFRAGRPAVEAARAAADEWLKSLTP